MSHHPLGPAVGSVRRISQWRAQPACTTPQQPQGLTGFLSSEHDDLARPACAQTKALCSVLETVALSEPTLGDEIRSAVLDRSSLTDGVRRFIQSSVRSFCLTGHEPPLIVLKEPICLETRSV
ncbi:unnamed protein product [Leuciscus chuanchicus]